MISIRLGWRPFSSAVPDAGYGTSTETNTSNSAAAFAPRHSATDSSRCSTRCKNHLDGGVNFVRPHLIEREAAERLIDLVPSAEMVKFSLNGSDATTAAIRLARAYTNRDMVAVCRQHPFFSTDDWFIVTTPMAAGIPKSVESLTVQFSYNDLADLARVFEEYPGQIAAVILEAETARTTCGGLLRWFAAAV